MNKDKLTREEIYAIKRMTGVNDFNKFIEYIERQRDVLRERNEVEMDMNRSLVSKGSRQMLTQILDIIKNIDKTFDKVKEF